MLRANSDLLRQSNRIAVQFLLIEMQTGLTFLDVARTAMTAENRKRNCGQARDAYDTALRLLPRVSPTEEEKLALDNTMKQLKHALTAAGYSFELMGLELLADADG